MVKLSKERKRKLIRNPDGTFKEWKGGKTRAEVSKKRINQRQHGIGIHIGKEYKRQHGKTARVGDSVRTKKQSGAFHKGAMWYVRTRHGWRKSPTGFKKPTKAQIKKLNKSSRKGR